MRDQIDIKIVTTEARGNYLILEPNYHAANIFGKIFGKTNEKKQVRLNQSVQVCRYWRYVKQKCMSFNMIT